jgi:hypothetical protein
VKLRAIEPYSAGVDIVPVVTMIVNGVNNEQVDASSSSRSTIRRRSTSSFHGFVHWPGRRSDARRRAAQRCTLSHLTT